MKALLIGLFLTLIVLIVLLGVTVVYNFEEIEGRFGQISLLNRDDTPVDVYSQYVLEQFEYLTEEDKINEAERIALAVRYDNYTFGIALPRICQLMGVQLPWEFKDWVYEANVELMTLADNILASYGKSIDDELYTPDQESAVIRLDEFFEGFDEDSFSGADFCEILMTYNKDLVAELFDFSNLYRPYLNALAMENK